jgi:hypothetical protein
MRSISALRASHSICAAVRFNELSGFKQIPTIFRGALMLASRKIYTKDSIKPVGKTTFFSDNYTYSMGL